MVTVSNIKALLYVFMIMHILVTKYRIVIEVTNLILVHTKCAKNFGTNDYLLRT